MWLITYRNDDCKPDEKFYQHVFGYTCPDTSYIACYLKHAGIAEGESWDIRVLAQSLVDGESVEMVNGNVYSLCGRATFRCLADVLKTTGELRCLKKGIMYLLQNGVMVIRQTSGV